MEREELARVSFALGKAEGLAMAANLIQVHVDNATRVVGTNCLKEAIKAMRAAVVKLRARQDAR